MNEERQVQTTSTREPGSALTVSPVARAGAAAEVPGMTATLLPPTHLVLQSREWRTVWVPLPAILCLWAITKLFSTTSPMPVPERF